MRVRILAGALALVVAGCGYHEANPQGGRPAAMASYRLFIQGSAAGHSPELTVINADTGRSERTLPLGAAAPDWSRLYTIDQQSGKSMLRALNPASGSVLHETALDGSFEFPPVTLSGIPGGLSPNGKWLAVAGRGQDGYAVGKSRFMVFDTSFSQTPRRVELDGNFGFDALSNDGNRLYLIENLPVQGRYQVRMYDLIAGRLAPQVVIDKTRGVAPMSGTRLYGLPSPDGQWLYSMFINGPSGPFIHALNLGSNYAWCINLSSTGKEDRSKQRYWALAMRPDGSAIYAVNSALGIATQVDMTNPPRIRRTATFPVVPARAAEVSASRYMAGKAALSHDGLTLFAPAETGVIAIDTRTLSVQAQYLQDRTIDGIAMSPDGAWLYGMSADRGTLLQVDPATGTIGAEVSAAGTSSSLIGVEAVR